MGLGLGPGLGDTNGPLAIVLSSTHSAASDWAGCGSVLSDVGEARTVLVEHAGEGLSSVQGTALSISGHLRSVVVAACLVFRLRVILCSICRALVIHLILMLLFGLDFMLKFVSLGIGGRKCCIFFS